LLPAQARIANDAALINSGRPLAGGRATRLAEFLTIIRMEARRSAATAHTGEFTVAHPHVSFLGWLATCALRAASSR
jgi:hypothetical protein